MQQMQTVFVGGRGEEENVHWKWWKFKECIRFWKGNSLNYLQTKSNPHPQGTGERSKRNEQNDVYACKLKKKSHTNVSHDVDQFNGTQQDIYSR